jgi:hypothetical protein
MTPDAIIAPDGTFRGVDDLNGFVERGARLLESSNAPELQKLARLLRLPMTQKVMVEDLPRYGLAGSRLGSKQKSPRAPSSES